MSMALNLAKTFTNNGSILLKKELGIKASALKIEGLRIPKQAVTYDVVQV